MTSIKPLLAKILIQVGEDEPEEIGTIEIPINVTIPEKSTPGATVNINAAAQIDHMRKRLEYERENRTEDMGA